MTLQDDFNALPEGVRQIMNQQFERYLRDEFEQQAAEQHTHLIDGFLGCAEVQHLWDNFMQHQWHDYRRDVEHERWEEFLKDTFQRT